MCCVDVSLTALSGFPEVHSITFLLLTSSPFLPAVEPFLLLSFRVRVGVRVGIGVRVRSRVRETERAIEGVRSGTCLMTSRVQGVGL